MEHQYTTSTEDQGMWTNGPEQIFCQWSWHEATRTLRVEHAGAVHQLVIPELEHRASSGIQLDFPETAKDVAYFMDRRSVA